MSFANCISMEQEDDSHVQNSAPPEAGTSPPGNSEEQTAQDNSLAQTLSQINTNMNMMADMLANVQSQVTQNISGGKNNVNSPGTNSRARKRRHDDNSDSEREESPKRTDNVSSEENDSLSVAASDDDVRDLLGSNDNNEQADPVVDGADDTLLQELETQLAGSEEKGEPIRPKLADIATKRWASKLDPEKLKSILDKHKQPENCDAVAVPRVNSEIWAQMSTNKKNDDLKISRMQQSLQKSTFAMLNLTDSLLQSDVKKPSKNRSDPDSLVKNCIDVIALLGHVAGDLSKMRRENIKPVLKYEFKSICTDNTIPPSQLLFGDDLAQRVRDAKETSKLGNTLSASKPPMMNPRYNRNSRNHQSSQRYDNNSYAKNIGKSFLWKGSKQPRRQRPHWPNSKGPQKPQ